MLRDFAAYRESQGGAGNLADAARLRKMAAGLASDTMDKMYQAEDGLGWFNVVFPGKAACDPLTVMQMRHVVDFFSVTFGRKFPSFSDALLQCFMIYDSQRDLRVLTIALPCAAIQYVGSPSQDLRFVISRQLFVASLATGFAKNL